ncbi:uncharacterized protein LOC111673993 [Orussus abietinus]|uniref:uncharacterized protein LOC111673993 n=1 Tax=Orussus abietinus TaxID=222816 RepID=UPI000C715EC4|nr:uncharacterized protein LOC111673993 [Orussus abietinus]
MENTISCSRCVVPGCPSKKPFKSSHRFPTNPEMLKTWLEAIGNEALKNIEGRKLHHMYRVCWLHFSSECFIPVTRKPILRKNAVPTLLLTKNSKYASVIKDTITSIAAEKVITPAQVIGPSTSKFVPYKIMTIDVEALPGILTSICSAKRLVNVTP